MAVTRSRFDLWPVLMVVGAVFLVIMGRHVIGRSVAHFSALALLLGVSTLMLAFMVGVFLRLFRTLRKSVYDFMPKQYEDYAFGPSEARKPTTYSVAALLITLTIALPMLYADAYMALHHAGEGPGEFSFMLIGCFLFIPLFCARLPLYWVILLFGIELWFLYLHSSFGPGAAAAAHFVTGVGFGLWFLAVRLPFLRNTQLS